MKYCLATGLVTLLLTTDSMAACNWRVLTNGNVADASHVMDDLDCKAPISSPAFSGNATISGTLGVGITSTPSKLTVASSNNASNFNLSSSDIAVVHNSNAAPTGLQQKPAGFTIVRDKASAVANGDILGGLSWNARYDAEDRAGYANITAIARSNSTAALTFNLASTALNPTEAMRIDYDGKVGINISSPAYTLHVNGTVAGNGAYTALSDARLKKSVRPIKNALTLVAQLEGVRFDWRAPNERVVGKDWSLPLTKHQVGFIAQDVQKVLPEAVSVSNDRDGTMSVAETKIIPLLVQAVKELKMQNEKYASKTNHLKAALDRQSNEIIAMRRAMLVENRKVVDLSAPK